MNVKNALQAIADREGVSIFEVRKEIQAAIDEGMKSTDKSVQTYWSKIPCKGVKPTPEEVVNYIAKSIKKYVCAEYKNSYRSGDNFIGSNCLPVDCDNDHSDNPEDWITPNDVMQAFGDFSYYNIGDRGVRSFKQLTELFAGNGMIGYVAKERVDGKLVLPEAVQILKVTTKTTT